MTRLTQSLVVFFVFLIGVVYSPTSHAQAVHGVLRVVKGDVRIVQAADGKEIKAKIGQKVFPKDTIIAGKDARAKVVMIDNNEINVSPESKVQIQNYEYKPAEEKKNVIINVLYGKVRAKVNQKYEGQNTFQVKTPSAVAGVRGTDFFTSYDRSSNATKVVTFEGRVAFGLPGPGGQIINPVMVSVGQTTSVVGNAPPAPPTNMPKNELSQMEKTTDAEKAPESPATESRQPAEAQPANKEDKKANPAGAPGTAAPPAPGKAPAPGLGPAPAEGGPGSANPAPLPNTGARMPGSLPPMGAPGGSMLMPGDLANAPNPNVMPILPEFGGLPLGPAPLPTVILPPPNDFLNGVIGSTRKKIIINVTGP